MWHALRVYMERYRFGSTVTEDLWTVRSVDYNSIFLLFSSSCHTVGLRGSFEADHERERSHGPLDQATR